MLSSINTINSNVFYINSAPNIISTNAQVDATSKIYTFLQPGTIQISRPLSVNVLCVGGGGGGGNGCPPGQFGTVTGGGGGAGGYIENTYTFPSNTLINITIGNGGTGGIVSGSSPTNGSNTTISGSGLNIIAYGGGYGAYHIVNTNTPVGANSGGSGGGGGSRNITGAAGNTSDNNYANTGGNGNGPPFYAAGGGGGAGGNGTNVNPYEAGTGGVGKTPSLTGLPTGTYYAYGGNGGSHSGIAANVVGPANTGAGGGGGNGEYTGAPHNGLAGGSGIVILAFQY